MQVAMDADAYQELSDVQHILTRPDMYIGPVERVPRTAKTLDIEQMKITNRQVLCAEGQEQTFLEIIANSADNVQRSRENNVDPGIIQVDMNDGWTVVRNGGMHIPVVQKENGMWIPHMIFGRLRTSSNYNDDVQRLYIGRNGVGAKATNVLSREFMVECADPINGRLYRQTWQGNMGAHSDPEITQYSGPGYTQISYSLDFPRFGVACNDQESLEIYAAHCAAVSYTCNVPVVFNDKRIHIKNLFAYANLFFKISKSTAISFTEPNGVYDICIVDTPDEALTVSFVNGVITSQGGVHVDAAYKVVMEHIMDTLGKAVEGIRLTKRDIINHVSLFISYRAVNPKFKSQTKDYLSGPTPNVTIPNKLFNSLKKWKLMDHIYLEIQRKQNAKLKRTDGKRSKKHRVAGCEDANFAGTKRSMECTLILTEGLSADSYRFKFISCLPDGQGRNFYGSLPLHGKILNVLNADFKQIFENRDITGIKGALGLKEDTDYSIDANFKRLKYGGLLVMPDPDDDGKHILGLVLLLFIHRFPSLVRRGFIKFLRIPTVRVSVDNQRLSFYSTSSFRKFMSELTPGHRVGHPEYFKGLGSSEDHHIVEDYNNPKVVTFNVDGSTGERIMLAFHKTAANLRKQWISDWVNRELIELDNITSLPISLFIDHELIDYSIENIIRSIPEAIDGLKESQRKALFAAFRKLKANKNKVKVAQVASHAAEITCYKHGESCLADAIVTMTYDFMGSNNMPYFQPRGQFGTRKNGGKDAANPRYTYISLPWWLHSVFRKEDNRLEVRLKDEGEEQECENFFPIIPMHLVNGVIGIGTAYSTKIPSFNPLDIVTWLQQRLRQDLGEETILPELTPWYKGFTGLINVDKEKNSFTTEGIFSINNNQDIIITELPVGLWTNTYVEKLNRWEEKEKISTYERYDEKDNVKLVIKGWNDGNPTLKKLKLINTNSFNNMTVLYRTENRGILPRIYNSVDDMLQDFYKIRLAKYDERKRLMIDEYIKEIHDLNEKARYIRAVAVDQVLEVRNRPERDIFTDMDSMGFNHALLDKVKVRELTKDQIPALLEKIRKKEEEMAKVEAQYIQAIWYNELEEFVVKYCRHEKCQRPTV